MAAEADGRLGRLVRRALAATLTLTVSLAGCQRAPPIGTRPIPLADRPPWRTVLATPGFRIAMDTSRVRQGPEQGWLVWFVTTHATPQGPDSMRFDRGRIRLLVRCDPLGFKSVSQELALGDARPVFHLEWPRAARDTAQWRVPAPGATDDRFLRAACAMLAARRGRARPR